MPTLFDAFGLSAPIRLLSGTYPVREFTVGDLLDLQSWACMATEAPWEFPGSGDPEAVAGALYIRQAAWPPRSDTFAAEEAVGTVPWLAKCLEISPGLDPETAQAEALWLASPEGSGAQFWLRRIWLGRHPKALAVDLFEALLGREQEASGSPTDWPRLMVAICKRYPGITPGHVLGMTMSTIQAFVVEGKMPAGEFSKEEHARIAEFRAKGQALLACPPVNPPGSGDRPETAG